MGNKVIKPGTVFYNKRDPRKYHIVTILKNELEPQVVYKYYGIHKRWWHYGIESLFSFNDAINIGLYSFKRFK